MKTSKYDCIIFICGGRTLPVSLPPQMRPQKTTFLCSRNVGELNYSRRLVQGVTATLQEENLSLHFKCDSSLHGCLLSLLFLFNNLITSLDLIFLPQMSLQRFMPMNIHPLLKNWCLFLKAGAAQQLALRSSCLSGWQWEGQGTYFCPGRKRFRAPSCLLLEPPLPLHTLLQLCRAAENSRVDVRRGGRRFPWETHTALYSSSLRPRGLTLGLICILTPVPKCLHHLHTIDGWHHRYLILELQAWSSLEEGGPGCPC